MHPTLREFMSVWHEVSAFMAPEFRPTQTLKKDYCPYGSDMPLEAILFNDRYAAFVTFRERNKGADEVVRLEDSTPDEHISKKYEDKGMDAACISDGNFYFTAFMLVQTLLTDWQWKLKAEGKK